MPPTGSDHDDLRRRRKAQALLVAAAENDAQLRLELVRQLRDDPDAPFVIFYLAGLAGLFARQVAAGEGVAVEDILARVGRSVAGAGGDDGR